MRDAANKMDDLLTSLAIAAEHSVATKTTLVNPN